MIVEHPVASRYLTKLTDALADLQPADRIEVVQEIRQHIADAQAAGRSIDDVLNALGPAETLARAYRVELLLNPATPDRKGARSDRWLRIVGLVVIGSLPTFIIVVVLGSLGLSLSVSGFAVLLAGIWAATEPLPEWIQLTVPAWVAIAVGPALMIIGAAAIAGLVAYVKFVARLIRQVVPRAKPAAA